MEPDVASTITRGSAEFALRISQKAIMNINLSVAVVTKDALHGCFLVNKRETCAGTRKIGSLVAFKYMDPDVQCIALFE